MAGEGPTASERATLDPFEALAGGVPPRDQRDLMERPFFSLAKARRTVPILYKAAGVRVEVYAVPEHGMATIKAVKRGQGKNATPAVPDGRTSLTRRGRPRSGCACTWSCRVAQGKPIRTRPITWPVT